MIATALWTCFACYNRASTQMDTEATAVEAPICCSKPMWAARLRVAVQSVPEAAKPGNVDGRDFYELCQDYRWERGDGGAKFEAIKKYLLTGELPWPSYDSGSPQSQEGK